MPDKYELQEITSAIEMQKRFMNNNKFMNPLCPLKFNNSFLLSKHLYLELQFHHHSEIELAAKKLFIPDSISSFRDKFFPKNA